ncbi:MAG: hypothetical protein WCO78_00620 [Candidatus Roizmanbacteria bacterium]
MNMYRIQDALQEIINRKPHITELLGEGLVNIMELARMIKPELERECMKEMTIESIAMAIRRMPKRRESKSLRHIFQSAPNITVRCDLVEYTFANSASLIPKKAALLQMIGQGYDNFFAITQGVHETSCILNTSKKDQLTNLIKGETVVAIATNLTAVTIRLPPENVDTPGVYYHILRSLYQGGVNVVDVVSTNMELTVIVTTGDDDKAFRLIKHLFD